MTDITTRTVRAYQELVEAQTAVRAAGIDVPMALDSAASVWAHGLDKIGLPAAERAALHASGASGMATVFRAWVKNPVARQRLAMDSAERVDGFHSRFPNAAPARVV
jgi:hypothetical protein